MAEMYAELMELNERLHKTVAGKDSVITALVTCLRRAGLEVQYAQSHCEEYKCQWICSLYRYLFLWTVYLLRHFSPRREPNTHTHTHVHTRLYSKRLDYLCDILDCCIFTKFGVSLHLL